MVQIFIPHNLTWMRYTRSRFQQVLIVCESYNIRGRDLVLATKAQILPFYANQKENPAMLQAPLHTLRLAIRALGPARALVLRAALTTFC